MVALSSDMTRAMSNQIERVNGNKTNGVTPPAKPAPLDSGRCEMRLALICNNGGTQSRAAIDWEYVGELIEALENHVLLPAIDVYFDGQDYWLADGFHRYEAHKKLNYPNIFANIHQGTRWNAVLHSVGSNATHGKRRTNADKNRAVKLMLTAPEAAKMSNREIAKVCKVSHQFVNDLQTDLKIERQFGKAYPREVATVAIKHKIQHREVMDEVERLYTEGRETFDEIRDSGWIQPDEEKNAVHISDQPAKVKKAIRRKQQNHAIVGAQASGKPYTPPAETPTDEPAAPAFILETQKVNGLHYAVIRYGGFATNEAALDGGEHIMRLYATWLSEQETKAKEARKAQRKAEKEAKAS